MAGSEFLIRRASGARLGRLTVMKGGGVGFRRLRAGEMAMKEGLVRKSFLSFLS